MIPVSSEADQLSGQHERRRRADPGLGPGPSRATPGVGRSSPAIVLVSLAQVLLLLLGLPVGEARADDATLAPKTLAGTWSATSLVETWSTEAWGDACGPKPVGQGAPSGTVQIAQQGSELTFSGAGRPFSTTQCWDATPGIVRKSHSGGARGWVTRCGSAPGDPRVATVTTNISATDDTIVLVEQGQYQFVIQDTTCKASASRRRSWKLVQRAGEAPPAPVASEAPAPSAPAPPSPPPPPAGPPRPAPPPKGSCEPGPPARLEVRPARKLARPGDAFDLSWSASDASGCAVRVKPSLVVEAPASPAGADGARVAEAVAVDERGRVTIDAKAPVGSVDVLVTLEGKTARVSIEITTPERFDALLAERGLGDTGEAETAVLVLESAVGGGATKAIDGSHDRRVAFLAIVGGAAAALALAALIVLRRNRKPRAPERLSTPAPPPLVALYDRPAEDEPMRCPQCREVFAPGTAFCATDGAALVPAPRARVSTGRVTTAPPAEAARADARQSGGKVCPTCGDRFEESATFCGRDGTQLVVVN